MIFAAIAFAGVLTSQGAGPAPDRLTPGAVVLLANDPDTHATEILRGALTNPNPDVRRAAARVASVAHPEAWESVRGALDAEQDPGVIAEFIKDLMALRGAQALPIVEPFANKAGPLGVAEIAEWFARMDAVAFSSHLAEWSDVRGASDRIGALVRLAILRHPEARDAILRAWRPVASPRAFKAAERKPDKNEGEAMLQTPSPFAAHLLSDTLAAAQCPIHEAFNGAIVDFAPDGRPRAIEVPRGLTPACIDVLTAIARISTADSNDPVHHRHEVVVPMIREFLACASEPYEPPLVPFGGPLEGVQDPKLTKEVRPDYNAEGVRQRLEGKVELDAQLSARGCVTQARVTRGLGVLDIKAIEAALRWKFDPATLGGRAVPIQIAVQLEFSLSAR